MKRKISTTKSIFKYERSECPVCMEEMCVESRSVTSPCMHEFCLECIGKWLTESSSSLCPLCKQSVKNIIYNIQTSSKYSKITFPKGFNNAWLLRNKTKNVLDNFENILSKIYDSIRTFIMNRKNTFKKEILNYLMYFGNLRSRAKSMSSDIEIKCQILENEICWDVVENLVLERLYFLYSSAQAMKIMNELVGTKCLTLEQILNVLVKYVDPIRFEVLKLEITTHFAMNQDSPFYLEYYIPGDQERVIYTKNTLMDESVVSALITRILTSINFECPNINVAGYQINNIDLIFNLLDYFLTYDELISRLSFSSHYILLGTQFYSANVLKKSDIEKPNIPSTSCDLIKHCFREEEFIHIHQALSKFEKRLIFVETLIVDDSNSSDSVLDSVENNIYIELSDSDDDALEIISVNQPVLDLTASSDDESLSLNFEDVPIKRPKPSCSSQDTNESTEGLSQIITVYINTSQNEPTTSRNTESQINLLSEENNPVSIPSVSSNDVECPSDEEVNTSFIYQPRSANDFYDYLMSTDDV